MRGCDPKGRVIVVSDLALTEPSQARSAILALLPILICPEDDKVQELLGIAMLANALRLKGFPEIVVKNIQEKHPGLLIDLLTKEEWGIEILKKARSSRENKQGPTNNFLVRGRIAGRILAHLSQPEINSLLAAMNECQNECHSLHGTPITPSIPTMKKMWREFRHISPLWAAISIYLDLYKNTLFFDPTDGNQSNCRDSHKDLMILMRMESFFRGKLLCFSNKTNNRPLIEDSSLLWRFEKEDGIQFPPLGVEKK